MDVAGKHSRAALEEVDNPAEVVNPLEGTINPPTNPPGRKAQGCKRPTRGSPLPNGGWADAAPKLGQEKEEVTVPLDPGSLLLPKTHERTKQRVGAPHP